MECLTLLIGVATTLTGQEPEISVDEDKYGAVITLTVYGNVSALIGKRGTTIAALRTLVKAIGYNGLHRVKLVLYDA